MGTWGEPPIREVEEYRLEWGCGPAVRVGDTVYRGSDAKPTPYEVKGLVFERGFGVRIVTDRWSDCGLFLANSPETWKKERINYLVWSTETIRKQLGEADREIAILRQEIGVDATPSLPNPKQSRSKP